MKWNVVVVVVHSRIVFARSTSFPLSEGRFFICEARFFIWKGFDFPRRKGGEEFSIIIIAASSSEWTGYLLKFWWFLSSETGDVILFYFYGRKLQVSREFFRWSVLVVLLWSLVTSFVIIMIVDLIPLGVSVVSLLIAFTIIKENFSAIAAATGKLLVLVLLDWEAKNKTRTKRKIVFLLEDSRSIQVMVASLAISSIQVRIEPEA